MSFRLSTGLIATILVLVHCSRLNAQGYQPLAGDFNRDGIWDIGLREPPTGMFYLRLGDGKGNFTEIGSHGWTADTKGGPYQPFAGDFNRDGIWDIGLRQPSTGTFYFRLGDGKGNFTEIGSHPGTSDSQGGIYRPFAGDFDKDGFGDIGVFEARTGKLHIKLGDGRGNFFHWAVNQSTGGLQGRPLRTVAPVISTGMAFGTLGFASRAPERSTSGWAMARVTSPRSAPSHATSFSQGGIYRPFAGDFNKDGFADIGVFEARTGKLHIKLRDGRGDFLSLGREPIDRRLQGRWKRAYYPKVERLPTKPSQVDDREPVGSRRAGPQRTRQGAVRDVLRVDPKGSAGLDQSASSPPRAGFGRHS